MTRLRRAYAARAKLRASLARWDAARSLALRLRASSRPGSPTHHLALGVLKRAEREEQRLSGALTAAEVEVTYALAEASGVDVGEHFGAWGVRGGEA